MFSIEYMLEHSELAMVAESFFCPHIFSSATDQDENIYLPMSNVPFDNPPEVIISFLINPFSSPQEYVRKHLYLHAIKYS